MHLRDYQVNGLQQIRSLIDQGHKRILLTMPTGSGKGTVIAKILSANPGKTCLFLVHRRELVFDISKRLTNLGFSHSVVVPGAAVNYIDRTFVATIQSWLSRHKNYGITPDIIVIDECHLFNPSHGMYRKLLDMYPRSIVLGFTATPTRSDGRGLGAIFSALVHPLTFGQAFDGGYLVRPRYYTPTDPDLSKVKSLAGDFQTDDLAKVMDSPKIVGDIVSHYLKYGQDRKAIGFAVRVSHSEGLAEAFNAAGIPSAHVDGNTPIEERDEIFRQLRDGEIAVLWNVDVCSEGVDIPDIGCVISARPTKSVIKWLQQIGRGLRPSSGKADCLVFDHGGTFDRLGPVEDYETWVLDDRVKANKATETKKKDKEPKQLKCPICSTRFQKSVICPSCGHVMVTPRSPEYVDGDLVEVSASKKKAKQKVYTFEEQREWLSQLTYIGLSRGYKAGWIGFKYKEKFGAFPAFKADPKLPSQEVINWVKHTQIRRAKQKH